MTRLVVALATALLVGCGAPGIGDQPVSVDPPSGITEEPPAGAVHPDAVWFEVLAISPEAADHGSIALATDDDELAELWRTHRFDGEPPTVDFAEQVVVVYGRAEDACPDDLIELRLVDNVLEATWLSPPGACPQPLISTAYAVALHRSDLPESFAIALRQHEGHGGDVTLDVELPPYDGPAGPEPSPPPQAMTEEELGTVFAHHALERCESLPHAPGDPPAPQAELDALQRELHDRFPDPDAGPRITWSGIGTTGRLEIGLIDPTREALDAIADVADPELVCIDVELSGLPAD